MLTSVLPDVTSHSVAETPSSLTWVGMEEIAIPVTINLFAEDLLENSPSEKKSSEKKLSEKNLSTKNSQTVTAKANVYVSLDSPDAKGIHMSRLHYVINQLAIRPCNKQTMEQLLDDIIESQQGLGQAAKVELSFELLLEKSALLSSESGFQSYPIKLNVEKRGQKFFSDIQLTIPYSSTCPCSASLARQLYANAIEREFSEAVIDKQKLIEWVQSRAGSVATPHSQRSYTYIQLFLENDKWPDFKSLIKQLEKVIGTPVQTAVKRSDEQEFARLNAENLMFCEDAARRIKSALEHMSFVKDYRFKVEHQESLHAHNAVVIDEKFNNLGKT